MEGTAASRWIFWAGLAVGVAFVGGLAWWTGLGTRAPVGTTEEHPLEGLQVFGTVPPFSLTERSGKPVTREELMGKVWIANFIYTHCPDTCPLQSAQMARLQRDLEDLKDLRLVSITVDPERDTPPVLQEYANRYGADPDRWLFLTGGKDAIYRLAQEGFRLSVVDPEERKTSSHFFEPRSVFAHHGEVGKQFIHSSRFVLVDRQARIRGYYPGTEEDAFQRLRRDVPTLLREEK
jgi:protein SCO1